jgi:hypothetical protein
LKLSFKNTDLCRICYGAGLIVLFLFFLPIVPLSIDTGVQAAQVTLAWDPSTDTSVTGYKAYMGVARGSYSSSVDVGTTTGCTLTGLDNTTTYYFAVTAYNAARLESAYSNEVAYAATTACTYAISPTVQSLTAAAGNGSVSVTTQSGCSWTSSSGVTWLTISSGASGTGSGTVNYSVAANTTSSDRSAALTIAGKVFTATQTHAGSQTYTIAASAGSGGSISPSGSVSVASGTSQTFTTKAASGYTIGNVLVDGVSKGAVASYTFSSVTAAHTISAAFKSATATSTSYTITASAGTGGSISPSGSVSVTSGTSKTFTVTPSRGHRVRYLLVDGKRVSARTSYTFSSVLANHSIQAVFR